MKFLIVQLVWLVSLLAQLPATTLSLPQVQPPAAFMQQGEKYPGQFNHEPPPTDWLCERPNVDEINTASEEKRSHWCSCERMWDDALQWMHNDEQCSVHCHEDKCTCDVSGDTPRAPGYNMRHAHSLPDTLDLEENNKNPFDLGVPK